MLFRTSLQRKIFAISTILASLIVIALLLNHFLLHQAYQEERALDISELPTKLRDAFQQRFPQASDVEWEMEDEICEAEFIWQGKEVEACFLWDGTWVRTEYPAEWSDFPSKAVAYLKDQQKTYTVEELAMVEIKDSQAAFQAELENIFLQWECLFDADGNLLYRVRDGPHPIEEQEED